MTRSTVADICREWVSEGTTHALRVLDPLFEAIGKTCVDFISQPTSAVPQAGLRDSFVYGRRLIVY